MSNNINIPPELIGEILSRLPASTLREFKRVCKAWRDMIDDPGFIRSHLDQQLLNSSDGGDQLVFDDHGIIKSYCFVPVGSLFTVPSSARIEEKIIKATPLHHHLHVNNPWNKLAEQGGDRSRVMSSCNGVMFVYRAVGRTLSSILWNPTTGESRELPPHTSTIASADDPEHVFMNAGFGYDYTRDDYKVVNITLQRDHQNPRGFESEIMVYSLKSDSSWRRIKDFPYCTAITHGFFLNGALHWVASTIPGDLDLIVGIDLGSEDYFEIRMPLEIMPKLRNRCARKMDVLGGCISIATCSGATYELWLMKDYRLESSWTKLFSIASEFIIRPVFYSKSKGIVVLENLRRHVPGSERDRIPEYVYLDLHNISSPKKLATVDVAASFSARSTFLLETLVRLNTTNGRTSCKRKRDEEET